MSTDSYLQGNCKPENKGVTEWKMFNTESGWVALTLPLLEEMNEAVIHPTFKAAVSTVRAGPL